jgi:metal-responsive CopG/Arc/MetJ family transcriptional regulator
MLTQFGLVRNIPSYGIIFTMEMELISIKVPERLKQRLRKAAEKERRNLSDFVRLHLEEKLDEEETAPTPQKKGGKAK